MIISMEVLGGVVYVYNAFSFSIKYNAVEEWAHWNIEIVHTYIPP